MRKACDISDQYRNDEKTCDTRTNSKTKTTNASFPLLCVFK